ncbi:MAG: ABC transporter substrate-binding protein [Proteobacteria bacterium]|nr:ABC transporter substrate-binding protein [Pseudomonadota bacterium]
MKKPRISIGCIACIFLIWYLSGLGLAQSYPRRIVSLGPVITEQLYLLGVQDRLIGCTVYCKRPAEAEKKERVGTVIKANVEKIVSLRPDLVICTSLSDPKQVKKLRNLGMRIVLFPAPKNFYELCVQFKELGRVVGKEKEAEEIITTAKRKVESLEKKIGKLQKPRVFVQIGAKPLFSITEDSFINDYLNFAGGINIASKAKAGLYSREQVLKDNPDVIIIVGMGINGGEERKIWKGYETMNAARNDRIYSMDPYKLCSPTPVSFVETLEEMVTILHPRHE